MEREALPATQQLHNEDKPRCHWFTHGAREQVAPTHGTGQPWGRCRRMTTGFRRALIGSTKLASTRNRGYCRSRSTRDALRDWWLRSRTLWLKRPASTSPAVRWMAKKGTRSSQGARSRVEDQLGSLMTKLVKMRRNAESARQSERRRGRTRDSNCRGTAKCPIALRSDTIRLGVILVYLGFLNTKEIRDKGMLASDEEWPCVKKHVSRFQGKSGTKRFLVAPFSYHAFLARVAP